MPSRSWRHWNTARSAALDEIEAAHRTVGGTGPGRRYATQQLNRAYAVLLAGQFQGFCRDLHSECIDFLVGPIALTPVREALRRELFLIRRLDSGNATQGNIAADFDRLGVMNFWTSIDADHVRNSQCRQLLDRLNTWRNAIAHQDFDPVRLGGSTTLRLETVQRWHRACRRLALSIDAVLRTYLQTTAGVIPW